MKTLNEALACLKTQDGVDRNFAIHIDEKNHVVAEHSDQLPTDPAMMNIVDIAREVATDSTIESLREFQIANILNDYLGMHPCPPVVVAMLQSAFSSGMTYGVRVGMEMERAEFDPLESLAGLK